MSLSKIIKRPGGVPWFIVPWPDTDGGNFFLNMLSSIITLDTIPEAITDTVKLNYSSSQIPGGSADIARFGSIEARRVSFSIDVVNFNDDFGVTDSLAQFAAFRRPTLNITSPGKAPGTAAEAGIPASNPFSRKSLYVPFTANPSAIYWHGVSSIIPLLYRVTKCDFNNSHLNALSRPQKSTVSMELIEDVSSFLTTADISMTYALGVYRTAKNAKNLVSKSKGHPFRQGAGF